MRYRDSGLGYHMAPGLSGPPKAPRHPAIRALTAMRDGSMQSYSGERLDVFKKEKSRVASAAQKVPALV